MKSPCRLPVTIAMLVSAGFWSVWVSPCAARAVSVSPNPPWSGLPKRTTVRTHSIPGDPVNIAFEGSKNTILAAFQKAGWVKADPLSIEHDAHLAEAALHHGKYPAAPVSNLYLFGRSEDFAVEHERGSVSSRDHARLWDTKRQDQNTHLEIWIGDCSRDIGIKIVHKNHHYGTTHRIDGNLDAERALIVSEMKETGRVSTVVMEPGMGPTRDAVNGGGDLMSTDGKVALIVLKK